MKLFLSPHDDDQILFGAFTLMREKPLVVICTESFIQSNRGENITNKQRAEETNRACDLLGCPVIRLGLRDDVIDEWSLKRVLGRFHGFSQVYAPAIQGGNKDHDLVGKVAQEVFGDKIKSYATYAQGEWFTKGKVEIIPTALEVLTKKDALSKFESQINLAATKGHFEAVKGQSEWMM